MTIYGSDVSHYDASDTRAMLNEGIVFQTHKAGGDANDAELNAWWRLVKPLRGNNLLLGAYWVLYPGNPRGRADAFLARLDSQCEGWRDAPFILQVDCEKWNGDSDTVPSKNEIKAFCDRLVGACPKLRPIVYAPKWVYGNTLNGLGYPLWASAYVNGSGGFKDLYPGDSSSKWVPYSGITPDILQYSSSARIGGQTTCDANAYRGSLKDLKSLLAPGFTPRTPEVKPMLTITGNMPVVGEGDNDEDMDGYNMVTRIQLLKRIDADGIWGPKTTAAVGGKIMTESLYRAIFGMTVPPVVPSKHG